LAQGENVRADSKATPKLVSSGMPFVLSELHALQVVIGVVAKR
jgi:hypothetical protein